MIHGLQITMLGEELSRRIAERIQLHEATVSALDVRINERAGDLLFDVRAEDGFQTLGELEGERQNCRDRITQLGLIRNGLASEEIYVLNRADLRIAELISGDSKDGASIPDDASIATGRMRRSTG